MKVSFAAAAIAGLVLSSISAPAFSQSGGSGSCQTLSETNPAAYQQLCVVPREYPDFGDQIQGDGDAPSPCIGFLPKNAQWGDRVQVAAPCPG
ncbi:hypothetical protein SAMN02983003_1250 [Devosia enhydra]|uniref:Porin n=2 Tax=Devosia enhydra TaxID=665118 RepID=A0A1K2HVH0_9HYPH|nr:hypothetical protein SAMN02983003_1250 [Devosia enhydra]